MQWNHNKWWLVLTGHIELVQKTVLSGNYRWHYRQWVYIQELQTLTEGLTVRIQCSLDATSAATTHKWIDMMWHFTYMKWYSWCCEHLIAVIQPCETCWCWCWDSVIHFEIYVGHFLSTYGHDITVNFLNIRTQVTDTLKFELWGSTIE